mmetsp:Transcript_19652/g.54863  ORF Transcript_19652/g.54863 Transcript_19652/m.54863 type:complete len:318 (+) Transcript_19652:1759-2712(+)
MNIKPGDANAVEFRILAIGDGELQVVVEEHLGIVAEFGPPLSWVRGRSTVGDLESHGISADGVVELRASHENRQAVQLELNAVLALDEVSDPAELLKFQSDRAHGSARHVHQRIELEGGGRDFVTLQSGPQVPSLALSPLDRVVVLQGTSRQIVVFVGDLGLLGFHQIGVDIDLLVGLVLFRRHPGEENLGQRGFLFAQETLSLFVSEAVVAEHLRLGSVGDFVGTLSAQVLVGLELRLGNLSLLAAVQSLLCLELFNGSGAELLPVGKSSAGKVLALGSPLLLASFFLGSAICVGAKRQEQDAAHRREDSVEGTHA